MAYLDYLIYTKPYTFAVLLNGRSSTGNSETQISVLLEMDRCGSFLLLSVPHSLFRI